MAVVLQHQPGSAIKVSYAEVTPHGEVSGVMSTGWGGNGAQSVRTYQCNFADRLAFEAQALGYPQRIPGTPVVLAREVPLADPEKRWYYATRISRGAPFGRPGEVPFVGQGAAKFFGGQGPGALYPTMLMTVLFEPLPYRVISNINLQNKFGGNELFRYCTLPWENSGEMLTRSVGNETWKFDEGAIAGTTVNYTSNIGQWVPKNEWEIIWHQVPEIGIRDKNTKLLNSNILGCVGKLNNAAWPNPAPAGSVQFPAGTLRLNSVKTVDVPSAVDPAFMGLQYDNNYDPAIVLDVHFMFTYFDPSPLNAGATTHGHNLMPYQDGTWANAKTVSNGRLYATTDFSVLLQIT